MITISVLPVGKDIHSIINAISSILIDSFRCNWGEHEFEPKFPYSSSEEEAYHNRDENDHTWSDDELVKQSVMNGKTGDCIEWRMKETI